VHVKLRDLSLTYAYLALATSHHATNVICLLLLLPRPLATSPLYALLLSLPFPPDKGGGKEERAEGRKWGR